MVLSCQPSHVTGNLQRFPQEKIMLVSRVLHKGLSPLVPSQPPGSTGVASPSPPKRQPHQACRSTSTSKRKVYFLRSGKAPTALRFSLSWFQKRSRPYLLNEAEFIFSPPFFCLDKPKCENYKTSSLFLGLSCWHFKKVCFPKFFICPPAPLHHSLTLWKPQTKSNAP